MIVSVLPYVIGSWKEVHLLFKGNPKVLTLVIKVKHVIEKFKIFKRVISVY